MILVHSTHEAGFKVGGIGAALEGLLGAPSYLAAVQRTLLVGPMNTRDPAESERLFDPHQTLRVRYAADRGLIDCAPLLAQALDRVEREWGVRLLYGTRAFGPAAHEILLVDASNISRERLNLFKYQLWRRFGLDSLRYEREPEYDQYLAAAQPALTALMAVLDGERRTAGPPPTLICHEFMGLPLWHAAELAQPGAFRGVYVAHEVPAARALVESHPGHDVRFYNAMRLARQAGLFIDDVFGDQSASFKHALVQTASRCDRVLAVGDWVMEELRFLSPAFQGRPIRLAYNAVQTQPVSLAESQASKRKLQACAKAWSGITPAFVFTHVARAVISKGLWRDIRVMEELDPLLAERGESAVLFLLASAIPQGRSSIEAQRMGREYGWPRAHREGWPDLHGHEAPLWQAIAAFNAGARASRIVFINQYGFSRERIGDDVPPGTGFQDLRQGTDLEFGQSVYEAFGISQLEPLASGALCVVSNVCGCVGFARSALATEPCYLGLDGEGEGEMLDDERRPFVNLLVADYTRLPAAQLEQGWRGALAIGQAERDVIEHRVAHDVARRIIQRLPRTEEQKLLLLEDGGRLAQRMSWDAVARERFLPALA